MTTDEFILDLQNFKNQHFPKLDHTMTGYIIMKQYGNLDIWDIRSTKPFHIEKVDLYWNSVISCKITNGLKTRYIQVS